MNYFFPSKNHNGKKIFREVKNSNNTKPELTSELLVIWRKVESSFQNITRSKNCNFDTVREEFKKCITNPTKNYDYAVDFIKELKEYPDSNDMIPIDGLINLNVVLYNYCILKKAYELYAMNVFTLSCPDIPKLAKYLDLLINTIEKSIKIVGTIDPMIEYRHIQSLIILMNLYDNNSTSGLRRSTELYDTFIPLLGPSLAASNMRYLYEFPTIREVNLINKGNEKQV